MNRKIRLDDGFEKIDELFTPKIVAEVNGQHVKLARLEGDRVPWHTHDVEDELFYVLDGALDILTRQETIRLDAGEMVVVPRGVEHRVVPVGHVKLLLLESVGIRHTGDTHCDITVEEYEWL